VNAIVIGGGLSGLLAARELARRGMQVTLFESARTFGGAIAGAELGGITTDIGAEAFAITRPEALELIAELGLADQVIAPARSDAHLWSEAGIAELPRSLMGIPCDLSDPALTKILSEKEIAAAQKLDEKDFPADLDPQITLGELVRLRMGEPVVRRMLTPVVAGVHAIDPDLVEAEAVIPGLLARCRAIGSLAGAADAMRSASGTPGSAINGLRGGMTTLINALVADLEGVNVKSNRTVTAVRKSKTGWIVETADVSLRTDNVVLALSAPAARRVLRGQDRINAALEKFSVGDVAVVSLVVQSAKLDKAPVGSGVLVDPDQASVRAKALTHASAKWDWVKESFGPGTHLIRLSYGRDGVIEESLDELPDQARRDAERILGVKLPKVTDVKVTRWADSLVHQRVGHRQNVQALQEAVAAQEGLAIIGAGIGGNGIAGSIAYSRTLADQLGVIAE